MLCLDWWDRGVSCILAGRETAAFIALSEEPVPLGSEMRPPQPRAAWAAGETVQFRRGQRQLGVGVDQDLMPNLGAAAPDENGCQHGFAPGVFIAGAPAAPDLHVVTELPLPEAWGPEPGTPRPLPSGAILTRGRALCLRWLGLPVWNTADPDFPELWGLEVRGQGAAWPGSGEDLFLAVSSWVRGRASPGACFMGAPSCPGTPPRGPTS